MRKALMLLTAIVTVGSALAAAPAASAEQKQSDRPDVTQICHGGVTLGGGWDHNWFVTREVQAADSRDRGVVHGEWVEGKKAHDDHPAVPGYFKVSTRDDDAHLGDYLGPCVAPVAPVDPVKASTPAPALMQAYSVPADWVCDPLFTPVGAEVDGVVGGWAKSWQFWPHDGIGGFVCFRLLVPTGTGWALST
jgi:hypothetical protein